MLRLIGVVCYVRWDRGGEGWAWTNHCNVDVADDFLKSRNQLIVKLERRVDELERLVYVPGLWRCPRCAFNLMRTTLNVSTGRASADDTCGEKCPNCQSPLWRVTERDAGNELVERLHRLQLKLTPAEIQSGHDRVRWAEGLIRQLPETHGGRNSWLLNYAAATKGEG